MILPISWAAAWMHHGYNLQCARIGYSVNQGVRKDLEPAFSQITIELPVDFWIRHHAVFSLFSFCQEPFCQTCLLGFIPCGSLHRFFEGFVIVTNLHVGKFVPNCSFTSFHTSSLSTGFVSPSSISCTRRRSSSRHSGLISKLSSSSRLSKSRVANWDRSGRDRWRTASLGSW